jgi:hypothetical protein
VLSSVEGLDPPEFMSELALSGAEPYIAPSSAESQDHLLDFLFYGNAPTNYTGLQDFRLFSPVMSSLMFVNTHQGPQLTISDGPTSGNSYGDPDYTIASIENSRVHDLITDSLTVQSLEQTAGDMGQQGRNKRKAPSERKTVRPSKRPKRQSSLLHINSYIEIEKDKCARLGIPYSDQNSIPLILTKWISTLDKEDDRIAVCMISSALGSSESIALLQNIVFKIRAKDPGLKPADNMSPSERIREIQHLGDQIALTVLIRRCHVWKLYTDMSNGTESSNDGYFIETPDSINSGSARGPGNPNYVAGSEITKAMLYAVAPELQSGTAEYERQYRTFTKYRRLGQRLARLINVFGFGVLGLIPSQDTLGDVDLGLKITDEMCVQYVQIMKQ